MDLSYKGYRAKALQCDDGDWYGWLTGISDYVDFQASRKEDVVKQFHNAVDDYLAICRQIGDEPCRPVVNVTYAC